MQIPGRDAASGASGALVPLPIRLFGVARATICDPIAAGAQTVAAIGAQLKAGTNCRSCISELLKRVIGETPAKAGPQVAVVN